MKAELDEEELVRSVLSKNKAAFERLIKHYEGLVIHIVVPLIKNQDDRDDICQDVFLKVYEKLYTFQFKSKLSTWIGNIAYNTSIDFLRKKKRIQLDDNYNLILEGEPNYSSLMKEEILTKNPESEMISHEEKFILQAAVDKLPEIQRTLIFLFHQDELPLVEISEIMNMPVNTVKSYLFRARALLKEILLRYKLHKYG